MAERGQIFKEAPIQTPNKSWFDMSYDHLFSMNFGELIPSMFIETMAGDTIHQKSGVFARLAPMVSPAFGKINMFNYHFYVRNRDIWTNWRSFITNKDIREPWQQSRQFVPPTMPYLDVRKILYNGLWSSPTQIVPFNSETHQFTTDGFYDGSYKLIVTYDPATRSKAAYVTKEDYLPQLVNRNFYLFQFVPDKQDLIGKSDEQFYNPFGESSLFDYLGVDLTGMYNSTYNGTIDDAFGKLAGKGSEEAGIIQGWLDLHYYKDAVTEQSISDNEFGTVLTDPRYIDVTGIDIDEFLKSRCILSIITHAIPSPETALGGTWISYNLANGVGAGTVSNIARLDDGGELFESETARINALPLRAYYYIYSEYFRDQNYIGINPNVDFSRDGEDIDWNLDLKDIFDYLTLKRKAWEHDPYTTALPQPQKGEAVHIMPGVVDGKVKLVTDGVTTQTTKTINGGSQGNAYTLGSINSKVTYGINTSNYNYALLDPNGTFEVEGLSGATIENFRFANATQRLLEKMARAGSRYYEFMLAIFGVSIEDAKLNRPVYLDGNKVPIQISEVLQTSETVVDQPLGQMAGRAVAAGSDDYLEYFAEENGFFVEITTILPRVSYQQGLNPMFTRKVQLDYPFSEYAQLGEETVPTSEIYYRASKFDNDPLGYQSRYYQWKYNKDKVSSSFKSSLSHWTFSRIFDSVPVLGRKFLEVNPSYRQFAVADSRFEHVYCVMHHDININRSLPIFGVPTL